MTPDAFRPALAAAAAAAVLAAGLAGLRTISDDALVRRAAPAKAVAAAMSPAADASTTRWTCPMHPDIVLDHPGNCPRCGMTLVKLARALATGAARIELAPEVRRRMGVTVLEVGWREFGPVLRAPAEVVADERGAVSLAPKVEGWIRRLGVSGVGQRVRRGQALYEIYSPELQQRQRDYLDLLARRDALQAQSGGMPSGSAAPDLMLASVARERLRLRSQLAAADVPGSVLDDLDRTRRVHELVPVLAAHDGVVTAIGAREGAFVGPSQPVLAYADLSTTWAEIALTPDQLAALDGPALAELQPALCGGATVRARIDPARAVMDAASRTAHVRVPLPAGARGFLPGSLASAEIHLATHRALTVRRDAIWQTGAGEFVMLAEPDGAFVQAPVRSGAVAGDDAEIVAGLAEGQRVVTNGQFLLGAEASLQASRARLAADAL